MAPAPAQLQLGRGAVHPHVRDAQGLPALQEGGDRGAEEEGGDETTESPSNEEEGEENGETTTTKTTDEDVDSNSESTDEPQPAKKSWFGKVFDKKEPEEAAAGDL